MKVRVAHQRCTLGKIGAVVDVDDTHARSLIRCGMATPHVEVDDEPAPAKKSTAKKSTTKRKAD